MFVSKDIFRNRRYAIGRVMLFNIFQENGIEPGWHMLNLILKLGVLFRPCVASVVMSYR